MPAPDRVHLDHAATTALRPGALAAFAEAAALPGNPAALHASARRAKLRLEQDRERIATALGADPVEVVLTSGGTEADNLAVQGLYRARRAQDPARTRIVLTGVEHHAVLDTVAWLAAHEGAEAVVVPVDAASRVDLTAWEAALAQAPERTALAALMWANNEVGTVQPVAEAARAAAAHGVPLHTDAVQAVGAVPVDFAASGAGTLALSGHKLGAPVGVGALLVRRDLTLEPVLHGGGQERRLRSGTVSVALAAALAAALVEAVADQPAEARRLGRLRDEVIAAVDAAPGMDLTGPRDVDPATGAPLPAGTRRLPGNVHVTVPGVSADALLFRCDTAGLDTSSGSACTAGVAAPSHVLEAMGLAERARSTQRFTLGRTTTAADVARLVQALPGLAAPARRRRHP
ncbi:cysteine desulfurase family protein [Micrococcus sp.]|uniref:cysteine desulfurase family protein n=1 Tax=Micrococcus sp. TaxID=1271 RepID=UPI002A912DEF|nr:cysteine desulfurase family protein [Micrococcus sp.]MDY6055887.1 cysteine desulfurase family protein [Micrococcus sp.]